MIEKIVEHLNRAAKLDPSAVQRLVMHRESCNDRLAKSDLCITNKDTGFRASVSILGLLNALEVDKCRIVAHVDDDPTKPIRFEVGTPKTHPKIFNAND